jgi:hypothetical protein
MSFKIWCGVFFSFLALLGTEARPDDVLPNSVPVFKSGNWTVHRSKDPMTDKISCTGVYKGKSSVQLVADELFIRIPGGVRGIVLRFGEEAAMPMRLASEMEKVLNVIEISGKEFEALRSAKRLRFQALTRGAKVMEGELDLRGLGPALDSIQRGCPSK